MAIPPYDKLSSLVEEYIEFYGDNRKGEHQLCEKLLKIINQSANTNLS